MGFAAEQQTSTLRRQNYAWFYSEFNAMLDELSTGFPNQRVFVWNWNKTNSSWKIIEDLKISLLLFKV